MGERNRELAESHFSNRNVIERLRMFESIAGFDEPRAVVPMSSAETSPAVSVVAAQEERVPQEQLS